MINVENHGDWIHLSLFNLQKDRVFIIVFFLFSGILLFCWFVYFVCLLFTWVWHLFFFSSCFLLIGFRIWIHFSGVSFYFECAASRFQYNRWILFFSTWTIFGHLYDFHIISVHNSCLLPMKEGNHSVIMIFCWYFLLLNEIFFFKINDQKWWQNNCKIWSWNFNIKY